MLFPIMELAVTFVTSRNLYCGPGKTSKQRITFHSDNAFKGGFASRHCLTGRRIVGGCLTVKFFFCYRKNLFRDEKQSAADFIKRDYFSLDVFQKGIRILRVSRFLHSATLECADCFDHGEGDEARFKEILDEAFTTVLYDRTLMLLFAVSFGK